MLVFFKLFMLIMIDVKLTPSGLWWTAYLFVWMSRRRAGVVIDYLMSAWIAGAISIIGLWSLRIGSDLGCLPLRLF